MFYNLAKPDYLFEVSWEVSNKIGGIHTVLSNKALTMVDALQDKYITIGPDVWKETHGNPEFIEDKYLYRAWRKQANKSGLHFRIGRWNVPGNPVSVLVDFTPLFSDKNNIFSELWDKFGLNSLTGQWDYTEPALFGYAAGQIIESFYNYHLTEYDRIVAHFHEWMTGAGVLYLSDRVPQVGTVFTTHSTVLARSIASKGNQLYKDLNVFNPETLANELDITSKHSMEVRAARNADTFTTVSELASNECELLIGKTVDLITPSGFNLHPLENAQANELCIEARKKLKALAEAILNYQITDNTLFVATSGRYEFHNKGFDVLIESLANINQGDDEIPPMVVFLLVPANQLGVRTEILERIEKPDFGVPVIQEYCSHILVDEQNDDLLNALKNSNLDNSLSCKVKVIYVPAYLNGMDGVLDLSYYALLSAFDFTVFPSYYEPWGYTPQESLAYGVPSITSSLTGFGRWVKHNVAHYEKALAIVERNDENNHTATKSLGEAIKNFARNLQTASKGKSSNTVSEDIALQAKSIAQETTWNVLIENYFHAYDMALQKAGTRSELYKGKRQPVRVTKPASALSKPKWHKLTVEVKIPSRLGQLHTISKNLWWTWNYKAENLFASIDFELWKKCDKNPIVLLEQLSIEDYNKLLNDSQFMANYTEVVALFEAYMKEGELKSEKMISYFSMEYGLHTSVKIYSGGLGVLAGDYLKQASDDNINLVAIGLLYRYGYFEQNLSVSGEQLANYHPHNFAHMAAVPVRHSDGEWVKVSIAFPGRTLFAKVWRIDVGRIPLYLLDTDIPENMPADRFITHQLYGGDWENRFKQEFLLGIGGIRLLETIGIQPNVFHLNEGHAAFAGLERLRHLVQNQKLGFNEALEVVRASSLFTTHTPVPAGHDHFSEDYLRTYMPHYADRLGVSWETFMSLGKINASDPHEAYSMSVLATKLSQEVNGVSRLHGKVSRDMFKDMYPGFFPEELHIGYVTNGVHYGTWTDKEWQQLYDQTFGKDFIKNVADASVWEKIHQVSDEKIWNIRNNQRKILVDYIKERILKNLSRRQENPKKIYQAIEGIDSNVLTIGFARRFATYKRAHLLFNDIERLSRIVNNSKMPVQFIYAGKAHPADKGGQELIRFIIEVSRRPEFMGKVIFLEDYEMELGAALTRGVDVWLNTPTRPLEASGTSGMKAVLNGVLNFSVLDGWWAEGYRKETGWAIKEESTYDNNQLQDELDAETLYSTLEHEIIPMFYERNAQGYSPEWVRWIKNNLAQVAPHYTNKRMLDDYFERYYNKLFESSEFYQENNFANATEKTRWKAKCTKAWKAIEVDSINSINASDNSLKLGDEFYAEIVLDITGFNKDEIGVEVVFIKQSIEDENETVSVYEMEKINDKSNGYHATYRCSVVTKNAGIFSYSFRVFLKSKFLANRQDLPLLKWI